MFIFKDHRLPSVQDTCTPNSRDNNRNDAVGILAWTTESGLTNRKTRSDHHFPPTVASQNYSSLVVAAATRFNRLRLPLGLRRQRFSSSPHYYKPVAAVNRGRHGSVRRFLRRRCNLGFEALAEPQPPSLPGCAVRVARFLLSSVFRRRTPQISPKQRRRRRRN